MANRDYYKLAYRRCPSTERESRRPRRRIDNETEFNANQFLLCDVVDSRLLEFHHRDTDDSGVDLENGNPFEDVLFGATVSDDSELVSREMAKRRRQALTTSIQIF
ncbi:hypothetical protein EVAR_67844_1 [Eumeta japonica]|uniref:Uncharacterized protein n=1 Tax=Eumeta variegata TaxID=151549 RepID=A0A4C2AG50_EUMVA|nr:hypothetical protein EVAR_67844_1 [Eumeta japonica]